MWSGCAGATCFQYRHGGVSLYGNFYSAYRWIACENGSLAVSDFILCIILSLGLITPLITVMSYSDDIGKLRTILGEVTEVLCWEELKRPECDRKKPADYSINLHNVTFGYEEKEVLHGINMDIREGTVNALVGPSGSGKSTIAKLIASLWDVDGGSILIGGVDIRELSLEEYNRRVAYVSQDNYLFDDTIRENIRMGCMDATDAEVEEWQKRADATSLSWDSKRDMTRWQAAREGIFPAGKDSVSPLHGRC